MVDVWVGGFLILTAAFQPLRNSRTLKGQCGSSARDDCEPSAEVKAQKSSPGADEEPFRRVGSDVFGFFFSPANHLGPAGHPPHAAGAGRRRHGAAGLRPPSAEG